MASLHNVRFMWILTIFAALNGHVTEAAKGYKFECQQSGVCFWASPEERVWTEAVQHCKLLGAILACPSTPERLKDLYNYLNQNETFWIGLNSSHYTNDWQWMDKSPYNWDDIPWAPGHPILSAAYAYIENKRLFYSTSAETPDLHYVCQKEGPQFECQQSGDCYWASQEKKLRVDAVKHCQGLGAKLACPSTPERLKDLYNFFKTNETFWIGLNGNPYTNAWQWMDYSPYNGDDIPWASGHPRLTTAYAYIVNKRFFYSTSAETLDLHYVCQKASNIRLTQPQTETSTENTQSTLVVTTSPVSFNSTTTNPTAASITYTSISTQPVNQQFQTSNPACDSGQQWYYSELSNTCFLFENNSPTSTWKEVKTTCQNYNSQLASSSNQTKHNEIVQLINMRSLQTSNVWIGLYCNEQVGIGDVCTSWGWVDNSPYDTNWHRWSDGEPGPGEKWVRMRDEKWFATSSETDAQYYICEKKGNTVRSGFTIVPWTWPWTQPSMTQIVTDGVTESRTPNILVNSTGKVKQTSNLPLLAILLIIIPIAIIAAVVLLVRKGRLKIQPLLQRLKPKKEKEETNIEELQPYYISTNTEIAVRDLGNYDSNSDHIIKMHLEFQSIPPPMDLPQTIANKPINKTKNKFKDIKPFDTNRVVLSEIPGIENSDYINASLIDGYEHPKLFIASCSPTNHTMLDFWRMIWEYKIKCVIMLTQLMEGPKEMCKQYWPNFTGTIQNYGGLDVILEQEDNFTDFKCRRLKVKKGREERKIVQLHIESWMEKRILDTAVEILNLRREMRKFVNNDCPPILIHCRSGVRQTGTFVALDYLLQQVATEGIFDVAKCVAKLRNQRVKLIQNVDQYEFLYQAVTEGVLLGNTCILHSNFLKAFPALMKPRPSGTSKLDYEFKLMKDSSSKEDRETKIRKTFGHAINVGKNRNKNVDADDYYCIPLATKYDGRKDYINAAAIDNLNNGLAFIATEAPLQETAVEFWRAIWDQNCHIIIMLYCQEQLYANEMYHAEVEEDVFSIPPFGMKCNSVVTKKHISIKELSLSLTEKREVLHLSVTSDLKTKSTEELMEIFLSIYSTVKTRKIQSSHITPIFVHSIDGAEWTGMFCAFSCLLDQIKSDKEVDVFQVARLMRRSWSQLLCAKEQYRKLYEMTFFYIRRSERFAEDTDEAVNPRKLMKNSHSEAVDTYEDVQSPADVAPSSVPRHGSSYVNVKKIPE